MKKIIIWYVIITSLTFGTTYFVASRLPGLHATDESSIYIYNSELWKFRLSREPSRKVLLGPSYVAMVGHFKGFYNLGYYGENLLEIEEIINRYCKPEDQVYVGIGAAHLISYEAKRRDFPFSTIRRMKIVIQALFTYQRKPIPSNIQQLQADMLNPVTREDIDKSVLKIKGFWERHPSVHLVFFPANPRFQAKKMEYFHKALLANSIPIIDLSEFLTDPYFFDFFHQNEVGNKIIQKTLSSHAEGVPRRVKTARDIDENTTN